MESPASPAGCDGARLADKLNDRQRVIFRRLGEGKRDSDIAAALGLHEETVYLAVHRGLLRIGAQTRCHAIKLLAEEGFFKKEG